MGMKKTSMPHEDINPDNNSAGAYDGLVECLKLVEDLSSSCHQSTNQNCKNCQEKISAHGFNSESWGGYREFMRQYDANLNYSKILPQLSSRMPVWHRTENRLIGYFNRDTGMMDGPEVPQAEEPVIARRWIRKICSF